MNEDDLKEEYNNYLFNCHNQGDIWWLDYRAYSFEEWVEKGMPKNGGKKLEKHFFF